MRNLCLERERCIVRVTSTEAHKRLDWQVIIRKTSNISLLIYRENAWRQDNSWRTPWIHKITYLVRQDGRVCTEGVRNVHSWLRTCTTAKATLNRLLGPLVRTKSQIRQTVSVGIALPTNAHKNHWEQNIIGDSCQPINPQFACRTGIHTVTETLLWQTV